MNIFIELRHLPVERNRVALVVPITVEPEGADRGVLGHQLFHLLFHEAEVVVIVWMIALAAGVVAGLAKRVILPDPIQNRIVELEAQAFLMAGVSQIPHHILSPRGRLDDVVVRSLGVEHGKSVMVTGGYRHIARSGILESLHPFLGVVAGRVESGSRVGIFILVQAAELEIPLPLRIGGIYSPMQEYSKAVIDKLPTCLNVLRSRLIMVL